MNTDVFVERVRNNFRGFISHSLNIIHERLLSFTVNNIKPLDPSIMDPSIMVKFGVS